MYLLQNCHTSSVIWAKAIYKMDMSDSFVLSKKGLPIERMSKNQAETLRHLVLEDEFRIVLRLLNSWYLHFSEL
jgi:hypothetical protein